MKICTLCGETKALTEFYPHPQKKDGGLRPRCKTCHGVATSAYQKANADTLSAQNTARRAANPGKRGAQDRARYAATPAVRARLDAWRKANPEKVQAYNRVWNEANRELKAVYTAKRRAVTRQAIPVWADFDKISAVYAQAQLLRDIGIDVHVDHIVPLVSDEVCGLHVHDNLRVILASENLAKSNKLICE
jgi:hypothetical protein